MLIIDHVWVFVIDAILAVEVSVIVLQVLMGVFDRLLVMSRTPDHNADQQCATGHDSESNKRRGEADVGTQPYRQWVSAHPRH